MARLLVEEVDLETALFEDMSSESDRDSSEEKIINF